MLGGAGTACFAGDERREPKRVEGGKEGEGTDLTVPPPISLGVVATVERGGTLNRVSHHSYQPGSAFA